MFKDLLALQGRIAMALEKIAAGQQDADALTGDQARQLKDLLTTSAIRAEEIAGTTPPPPTP